MLSKQKVCMELLWDELKSHINPAEVDDYERAIGISRITRNQDTLHELSILRSMRNSMVLRINDEIEKKKPSILSTPQRELAIQKSIQFLDSLRDRGHVIDAEDQSDKHIINYLKYTRNKRPNSSESLSEARIESPRTSKTLDDGIDEIRGLLDEEYSRLTLEISMIRKELFSTHEELEEIKGIEIPTTESIENFNKKLKNHEMAVETVEGSSRSTGPRSISRLRESVRMNRLW